jgi:hypothetical protein
MSFPAQTEGIRWRYDHDITMLKKEGGMKTVASTPQVLFKGASSENSCRAAAVRLGKTPLLRLRRGARPSADGRAGWCESSLAGIQPPLFWFAEANQNFPSLSKEGSRGGDFHYLVETALPSWGTPQKIAVSLCYCRVAVGGSRTAVRRPCAAVAARSVAPTFFISHFHYLVVPSAWGECVPLLSLDEYASIKLLPPLSIR